MYLRLGLHVQIRLYYVLPYKAKISAEHSIGFILDRCIVYLGLTMPNLQKKRLLIFEIFNNKKFPLFFLTEYIRATGYLFAFFPGFRKHQPLSIKSLFFSPMFCTFKSKAKPYGVANQMVCCFQIFLYVENYGEQV